MFRRIRMVLGTGTEWCRSAQRGVGNRARDDRCTGETNGEPTPQIGTLQPGYEALPQIAARRARVFARGGLGPDQRLFSHRPCRLP